MMGVAFRWSLVFFFLMACSASKPAGGASAIEGTWVRDGFSAAQLLRKPAAEQILELGGEDDAIRGRIITPTAVAWPVVGVSTGDRYELKIAMAPGMEQSLRARLVDDRIELLTRRGPHAPPRIVRFRRMTQAEREALAQVMPARLPIPEIRALPPNGLAQTPPMGWNSWNHFGPKIDDATVRGIADALVASGMRDAGYVYVNIDDGWQGRRDLDGNLRPNDAFPDMKALGDYLHERGLKFGIYSSPGPTTCAGFEGSYGHEAQDARTFAKWGVDYLKYDWCSAGLIYDDSEMPAVYQKMAEALRLTGRDIVYSICQYGRSNVWEWAADAGGNLWRTTGDIADQWPHMATIGFQQARLSRYGRPGHWNDPDMLEIGNGGMTATEYRTHMSLWALLAAPLLAGNDLRAASPETLAILTHPEVIAIDQDRLGRQGGPVVTEGTVEVWKKPLAEGRVAIGVFNKGDRRASIPVEFERLGLGAGVNLRDVWAQKDLGTFEARHTVDVPPHGAALLVARSDGTARTSP